MEWVVDFLGRSLLFRIPIVAEFIANTVCVVVCGGRYCLGCVPVDERSESVREDE